MKLFLLILLIFLSTNLIARDDFTVPPQALKLSPSTSVKVNLNSSSFNGEVISTDGNGIYFTAIKVKNSSTNQVINISAEQNVTISVMSSHMLETEMVDSHGTSSSATSHSTLKPMGANPVIVWKSITTPNGSRIITTLLNPDYASIYQVYSSTAVYSETPADSFILVSKSGSIMVNKKDYRKRQFPKLFGDNTHFTEKFKNRKIEFRDFPEHLRIYTHYANLGN